jgi:hypothetical protein
MLCLNIWLDESKLVWERNKRNIFTAHEVLQIVPIVNKNQTYERFIKSNRWALDYWPKAIKDIRILGYKQSLCLRQKDIKKGGNYNFVHLISRYLNILISKTIEPLAFKLQYFYMKSKITIETITPTRALFHPKDMTKDVLGKLEKFCEEVE